MKKSFRLALDSYNPFLVLRNEERFGMINALYLDYMLDGGKIASIAVMYDNGEVLKDLYTDAQPHLTGQSEDDGKDSLSQYIHIFQSKEEWIDKRINVMSTKDWNQMCDFYYNMIVKNIKGYDGAYSVSEVYMIREPFNMVCVNAVKGDSQVEVKAVNKCAMVYDLSAVDQTDATDYMDLVAFVNQCIGGEPVWR